MKTIWKVLGGIGLQLVIIFSGTIGEPVEKASAGSIDEYLQKYVSEQNSKLPMMVDSETRLDSMIVINKTICYYNTVVHYSASNEVAQKINAFGPKIVNRICTSKETQKWVKNGFTFSYAYYDNDGKQITVISVAPSQCGNF